MAWQVVKRPDQSIVHIIPLGDFEPHDESEDCRCEPQRRTIEDGACDLLIHEPYNSALAALTESLDDSVLRKANDRTEFII